MLDLHEMLIVFTNDSEGKQLHFLRVIIVITWNGRNEEGRRYYKTLKNCIYIIFINKWSFFLLMLFDNFHLSWFTPGRYVLDWNSHEQLVHTHIWSNSILHPTIFYGMLNIHYFVNLDKSLVTTLNERQGNATCATMKFFTT